MGILGGLARAERDDAPPLAVPPGATLFRSGGKEYYLYLDLETIVTLQRGWGFVAGPGDTVEDLERKHRLFYARLNGAGPTDDHVEIIRVALGRWQRETGRPQRDVSTAQAVKLLEALDPEFGEERLPAYIMAQLLLQRFLREAFGTELREKEPAKGGGGEQDPNAPSGAASTQSVS